MRKRAYLSCLVFLLLGINNIAKSDLVNRYSFTDGDITAVDSVSSNNGTLEAGAAISGNQLILNGDSYVNLPATTLDIEYTSITIEAWFTLNAEATWQRLFDFGDASGNNGGYYIFYASTAGSFRISTGGFPGWSTGEQGPTDIPSVPTGSEIHVACVYDNNTNTMSVYQDGVLVGTPAAGITMPLSGVHRAFAYIGNSVYSDDPKMNGSVNEFRIYDEALNAATITRHYTDGPDVIGESPIVIQESGDSTEVIEGNAVPDTYNIHLVSQPGDDVTVTVDPDEQLDLGSGQGIPIYLYFDDQNWADDQQVNVIANDDDILEENPHNGWINHMIASTDPDFDDIPLQNVIVKTYDNECGTWGYHYSDLTYNCFVDIEDLAIFASLWLSDENPINLAKLAEEWIWSSLPYASGATVGPLTAPRDAYVAYLMPYFDGGDELLRYAYSYDARNWTALNGGNPLPWSPPFVRDPFMNRANGKFHFVYTTGWTGTTIGHMVSDDLINWAGGQIQVVDSSKERCWAPEFFYLETESLFYVYWASVVDGHNTMHYLTTQDWTNITPADSGVYYNIGIHDIDLTIVEYNGAYCGFHKPGDVGDQMGNRLSISTSLDPTIDSFADDEYGQIVFSGENKPTEGPEVIKIIGEEKWYVYGDPFNAPLEAWETTDFVTYTKISVSTPSGAKHCSMVPITQTELDSLLAQYP